LPFIDAIAAITPLLLRRHCRPFSFDTIFAATIFIDADYADYFHRRFYTDAAIDYAMPTRQHICWRRYAAAIFIDYFHAIISCWWLCFSPLIIELLIRWLPDTLMPCH
jgi:hypothetical protein